MGREVARGTLRVRGMLLGFAGVLAASLLAAVPIGILSYVLFLRFREAALYQNNVYALGFHLYGISMLCLVIALFRRWARPQEMLAGGLIWWVFGLLLMQVYVPGGSNQTLWPLIMGSGYLLVLILLTKDDVPSDRVLKWSVLLALPTLMFIAPMIVLAMYGPTVMASFLVVPLTIILCVFLLPQLHRFTSTGLCKLAGGLALAGILLVCIAYVRTLPSPKSPLLNSLAYGIDFDAGEAWWLSGDRKLDEWTSRYIPEGSQQEVLPQFLPGDKFKYYKAPAPMPPFGKPVLEIVSDRIEDNRRILECRLDSPRDAQRLSMRVVSDTEVYGASILGNDLPGAAQGWDARFEILPREGADLRLEVEPNMPLRIAIHETSFTLNDLPDYEQRPPYMMPEPNRRLDRRRSMNSGYIYSTATIDLGIGESK